MHVLANILRSLFVARTPTVEAHSPDCRSNVENAPVDGRSAAAGCARFRMRRAVLGAPPSPAGRRPATRADPTQPAVRTMSSYRGMDASLLPGFALCCHSNATRVPLANPPNSAQLGGSLYHTPKLHLGPCSSVGVRPRTDRHTDARDHNTFCVLYDSRRM